MARHTQFIQLSDEERRSAKTLFRSGKGVNRLHTRARILHLLDREVPPPEIALTLSCGIATVYNIKRRYLIEGLEMALADKARGGRPPQLVVGARPTVRGSPDRRQLDILQAAH
jgi:transposase